jgi:hypothetical protein
VARSGKGGNSQRTSGGQSARAARGQGSVVPGASSAATPAPTSDQAAGESSDHSTNREADQYVTGESPTNTDPNASTSEEQYTPAPTPGEFPSRRTRAPRRARKRTHWCPTRTTLRRPVRTTRRIRRRIPHPLTRTFPPKKARTPCRTPQRASLPEGPAWQRPRQLPAPGRRHYRSATPRSCSPGITHPSFE